MMIKKYLQHIKENNTRNFRVGDIVVCIDNSDYEKYLKINDISEINDIEYFKTDKSLHQIKLVNNNHF